VFDFRGGAKVKIYGAHLRMSTIKIILRRRVPFSLVIISLFLFFLASSAPHQVHHYFEPHPEDTCVIFTYSKGCHIKPISIVNLSNVQITVEEIVSSLEAWIPYPTPSLFAKRAPPVV
jgi:hypothetical protein